MMNDAYTSRFNLLPSKDKQLSHQQRLVLHSAQIQKLSQNLIAQVEHYYAVPDTTK